MNSARLWIDTLRLQPHPEGGFFAETYRAAENVAAAHLPARFGGDRNFSTAIYFLLESGQFSAFHRIRSDEVWHFYDGGPLEVYVLHGDGRLATIRLGRDPEKGERPQAVVPSGCWFASRPAPGTAYSLVGCTVAPGFDFADFELASASNLTRLYPIHTSLIRALCRIV